MAKSADAFRTISEVADWLGSPAHVLRFWESRFTQVKPVKRAGGRRYYRPDDMLLLGGIKKLLHDDGMTIKGVQKILKEEGIKKVAAMSHPLDVLIEETEPETNPDTPIASDTPKPSAPQTPPKPAFIREEPVAPADVSTDTEPMPPPAATASVVESPTAPSPAADEGFDLDDDINAFISEAEDEPQFSAPVETPPDPAPIETPPETADAPDDSDPAPAHDRTEPDSPEPESYDTEPEPEPEPETETETVVNPVYSPQDHTPAPVLQPELEPEPTPKPALVTTPPDPSDDDVLESGSAPDLPIAGIDRSTLDTDAIARLNSVFTRLSALRDRIKSELGPKLNR